ncbi:MAG: ATP-dependent RecD-like DNA helicase, partial [Lachnospiraceae bacterium]|nr:ATP-dependent RecD-like DNA helicase [Lachnospiraceae bacterium]
YIIKQPSDIVSITRYLGSGAIKGLKLILAERIVKEFGEDTFNIIENEPERLAEVRGISMNKAMAISEQIMEKREMRQAMMFLQSYGISIGLTVKIYNYYGQRVYDVLKNNPYQMADEIPGVGFKMADEIAKNGGIEVHSSFRIKSGMIYTLTQASSQGHTFLPKDQLVANTIELLELGDLWKNMDDTYNFDLLDNYFSDLIMDGKIIIKQIGDIEAVFLSTFYYTEISVAKKLYDLNTKIFADEELTEMKLEAIQKKTDIELDQMQKKAVMEAMTNGLLIITGGPGTGKTTTINAIIRLFESEGMIISLAAPTGRAAKRMTEATGHEAQTIHRLLELKGLSDDEDKEMVRFEKNEENPLLADAIIVDEMSMVDIFLVNALLKAIPEGTRLILVGDSNQLPSVGPGNVLKDIIASDEFNVVKLDKIFRQAGESDIVVNAHKINRGEHFALDNKSKDFLYLSRATAQEVVNATVGLVMSKLPKYVKADVYDIQVLTPMRKGLLGVEGLNEALQQYLNPPSDSKIEKQLGAITFRTGDKVMQIKNNYQLEWEQRLPNGTVIDTGAGVFNGDIGRIRRINLGTELMEVEFEDGKFAIYTFKQIDELELAYAVTIHKSQGSEYPAVVMPLLAGSKFLLNRNLLYTGVTRAKKCVCIVGSNETFQNMIDNESQQKRYSALNYQINQMGNGLNQM